jgi:hypothetical protein
VTADASHLPRQQMPGTVASEAADASSFPALHVAAVMHAARGRHVFPCVPGDKRPAVDRWEQRACADPETVRHYWPSPRHNIGVACGPSRLVVVDLDCHGELPTDWMMSGIVDGKDVFAQVCEWAGQGWPATHTVATPSQGWHLYFQAPEDTGIRNSAGLIGPMVDVRAAGGYAVAACSIVGGRAYEALDDDDPAPLPQWIIRLLIRRPAKALPPQRAANVAGRMTALVRTVRGGQEGDRTGPLVWAAHRLAEMIAADEASPDAGELLIGAAVEAGIRGGERYARYQVQHVLGGMR